MPARSEHEERFRAAFERYYAEVLAYALRRVGNQADAEEVAGATFVHAWRHIDDLPAEPATRGWLYRAAWQALANRRRASSREARALERFGSWAEAGVTAFGTDVPDDASVVLQALDRLRLPDQEVLRLVVWEDLTHAEVAEVLGCSVGSVAVRLHRARVALRREIELLEQRRVPLRAERSLTSRQRRTMQQAEPATAGARRPEPGRGRRDVTEAPR